MRVQGVGCWKSVMGLNQDLGEQSGDDGGVEILCRVYQVC